MVTEIGDLEDKLARARTGEEAAFFELWQQLQPRLLRYLRVLNCDDADDIASETWLQVVRDLHKFSGGEEDFRRWLFTVGRHRAIDAARARQRRRSIPMAVSYDSVADDDMVEDQVLHALSVKKAVQLLSRLPVDQAEVVALRVIAGLGTPAVADMLGKSPGAVRVALHRGLRTLAGDPAVHALAAGPGRATDRSVLPPAASPRGWTCEQGPAR
ncbi:MAG TPA: sigma-70 family RNA polymerase sigma factor [Streptosporangiaceae bacterium]|nr:sigma-70 family RNA polymerase sigma factor [Streptosporangiaceae bacterium]